MTDRTEGEEMSIHDNNPRDDEARVPVEFFGSARKIKVRIGQWHLTEVRGLFAYYQLSTKALDARNRQMRADAEGK